MITERIVTVAAAVLGLAFGTAALAEGDAAKGAESYKVCVACHGEKGEGNQILGSPRIDFLPDWYITRQVHNFKEGIRGTNPQDTYGAQMRPMAQTLPDEAAVANVVAYIATLDGAVPAATVEGDVAAGKGAYTPCTACHGQNGEGNVALNAPPLAGQHDWYIVRQLQNFKAGVRGTHEKDTFGAQMRPMAMLLADDAAIKNVAAYIATLK